MVGWRALALALLLAAPLASADWLQEGGDAAHSMVASGPGPAWADLALRLQLPTPNMDGELEVPLATPLIVGDDAILLVPQGPLSSLNGLDACDSPERTQKLMVLELATGTLHDVDDVPTPNCGAAAMVTDGNTLLVASDLSLRLYSVADRALVGEVPNRPTLEQAEEVLGPALMAADPLLNVAALVGDCPHIAAEGKLAYVACLVRPGTITVKIPMLTVVDLEERVIVGGPWLLPNTQSDAQNPLLPNAPIPGDNVGLAPHAVLTYVMGVAVHDAHVALVLQTYALVDEGDQIAHLAYGGVRVLWIDATPSSQRVAQVRWTWQPTFGTSTTLHRSIAGPPVLADGWVHVKASRAVGRTAQADGGARVYSGSVYDGLDPDLGTGCVVVAADLVCGFAGRLLRLDRQGFNEVWHLDLPAGLRWARQSPALAGDNILALAVTPSSQLFVYAMDERTGAVAWTHQLGMDVALSNAVDSPIDIVLARMAVAGDVLLVQERNGALTVLGTTATSPRAHVTAGDLYPSTDASVRVDLHQSASGPAGGVLTYSADWGDGTSTAWQASPLLEHRYAAEGDTTARFFVRNDANQTASAPLTFHVGQAPPFSMGHVFHAAYRDYTLAVLGLLATALLAGFGVYRTGRKRRRFRRELRDLESDFKRLKGDQVECDAMLAERKARAGALFIEKRLDEAHSSFLERRIDAMRQGIRLSEVDDRLDFLPQGMVKALREMLMDTRVSAWERSHFMDALDRDNLLTPHQKAKVAKLVDGWFARDAA